MALSGDNAQPHPWHDLAIRAITQGDVCSIHELIGDIYKEYGMTLYLRDPAEAHLLDPVQSFADQGGGFWAAEANGQILATCGIVVQNEDGINEALLKSVYVAPQARRYGLASRMVGHAIDNARDRELTRMTLWTDTRFIAAHRFYESLGFVYKGERKLNDWNDSSEYCYQKTIS